VKSPSFLLGQGHVISRRTGKMAASTGTFINTTGFAVWSPVAPGEHMVPGPLHIIKYSIIL
jgi:hypothetical protein